LNSAYPQLAERALPDIVGRSARPLTMPDDSTSARQVHEQALAALTARLVAQGHPQQYAQHMAASVIFQADLVLRQSSILG